MSDDKRFVAHLQEPKSQSSLLARPGELVWYPKNVIPEKGWLLADGAYYLPSQHPALFQAIGYRFGKSGVNFRVLEVVDFIRPYDQISDNLFLVVNDEVHEHSHGGGSLSSAGAHSHSFSIRDWIDRPVKQVYTFNGSSTGSRAGGSSTLTIGYSGSHAHYVSADGGGGKETVPQHTTMALCICTLGDEFVYLGL